MDRDITAFLVQLSIALHKSAAYPPRHPLAIGAVESAVSALGDRLRERPSIMLGIARTQILLDGTGTDAGHPVLRDLAQKLYRREIGGVEFSRGVGASELSEFLVYVNGSSEGNAGGGEPPQWPHIRLAALAFDRLRLAGERGVHEDAGEPDGSRLWNELARTAFTPLAEHAPHLARDALDARALAAVINAQTGDAEYARAVGLELVALGEAARKDESAEARGVRRQLGELFANLSPGTLGHLLQLGPEAGQRQRLAVDVARTMPVGAVVDLVRRSAAGTEQTISHALLRILSKLAAHADATADQTAEDDEALREMVHELLQDWALRDPNPESYTVVLEGLARPAGPGGSSAPARPRTAEARLAVEVGPAEARRVVQMALEVDAYGEPVERAVETLINGSALPELIGMVGAAPAGTACQKIWQRIGTVDRLRDLLAAAEPDPAVVEPLVRRLGPDAADPLLDTLAEAQSAAVRRRLLSWLGELGSAIAPKVMARLDSPHWYVQRNMLVLLGAMPVRPPEFTPRTYLGHPDALVRREALKIALRVPELRDEAISRGLGDADEQNLRMTITSALDGCPPQALPFVDRQLAERSHSPELRALLVRVVGAITAPSACEWLVRRCLTKRVLLPGMRLAPKSAELVAAVTALAQRWPQHPRAAEVLRLAARSRDAELQAAAAAAGAVA